MIIDRYAEMRWAPRPGEGLEFDEQYRAAHLPHVSPDHPRAIRNWSGHDYLNGRYDRARVSLVADLGRAFLDQETCRRLLRSLESSSFVGKVAFDLIETRAPNIHCTLAGDVSLAPALRNAANEVLRGAAMFAPLLHGPFIGQFNRGRIYLPLQFDQPSDQTVLRRVNAVFGRRVPSFTAIGLVNLRDELDPREAGELIALLRGLQDLRSRLSISELSWTSTHDDLTLDLHRLETITLTVEEDT